NQARTDRMLQAPVGGSSDSHLGNSAADIEEPSGSKQIAIGPAHSTAKAVFGGVSDTAADPVPQTVTQVHRQGNQCVSLLPLAGIHLHGGEPEQFGLVELPLTFEESLLGVPGPRSHRQELANEDRVHPVASLHRDGADAGTRAGHHAY